MDTGTRRSRQNGKPGEVAFYGPKGEDGRRKECELLDVLQPFVEAYLETDAAAETICEQIVDMDREYE